MRKSGTLYITCGFGNTTFGGNTVVSNYFGKALGPASKNSTLVFAGNRITPTPKNWESGSLPVLYRLKRSSNFKGITVLLPRNDKWNAFDFNRVEKLGSYPKKKRT